MTTQYSIVQFHKGQILEEEEDLNLMEFSRICHASPEDVIEMVNEGILDPRGNRMSAWRFPFIAVERVWKVQHFQRDLGVNLQGAALALYLLDRIAQLESGKLKTEEN